MKTNSFLKLTSVFAIVALLSSCSSPTFKVLETTSGSGITMEGRYWHGLFSSKGSFEIRLTNTSGADCRDCVVILDGKYKHKLLGLHTRESGMIKDSVFHKGEQVTIYFSDQDSNIIFFDGAEEGYIPDVIELKCDNCDCNWNLK